MFKSECNRCSGKGRIPAFSNVHGGVCFLCAGKGFRLTKRAPAKPAQRFLISAMNLDGERVNVFTVSAKNAEIAISEAVLKLSGGNGFIPTSAAISEDQQSVWGS